MSVIIVGGGMAGATLALAISRLSHGALPVHLIEATAPESHAHPGFDGRAIALAAGTCQQLARIGVCNLWRIAQLPSPPCMSAIVVTLDLSPSPQKITNCGAGTGCPNCTMSGNGCLHCCVKHLA
ncbi:2-octaprenyl-6-methoxyphenol hydroxylase [Escherichia coli]|uniref:2-octaprenyl-6-methoxyphenol hydroxylase n=1 Tax=Escherichia coli TaxID=562 RepID=A0A376WUK2_ECOLX|nr:2-octaprenyl-6-methoxyphenol hydroxylase [Escherichia coli]